jgi:hypothetical protein
MQIIAIYLVLLLRLGYENWNNYCLVGFPVGRVYMCDSFLMYLDVFLFAVFLLFPRLHSFCHMHVRCQ